MGVELLHSSSSKMQLHPESAGLMGKVVRMACGIA